MSNVFVDPTDRGCSFVVVTNVAHELARKILYGSEDTSRNNVALNLGKPNFDLVEPAGVGRGVVDSKSRVGLEEFTNSVGLVRTQVISNDVDLATWRLACHNLCKAIDELYAGVACTGFSQHLSGLSVQSAVERKGSLAVGLKAMPVGPTGRKGQNPGETIHRLVGTLLVDPEQRGGERCGEVQTADVS